MIIALILSSLMASTFLVGVIMRRRSPFISVALMLASSAGCVFVWMPDRLTSLANLLGVGRGTDLVLYLWTALSFLLVSGLALQLRHLHAQFTRLVREVALMQARGRRTGSTGATSEDLHAAPERSEAG